VVRLFPDFQSVEADYFRRTRIFPIMHAVVIRKDVLERDPWVARSLYDAFCEAKDRTLASFDDTSALRATLPWLTADVEYARRVLGADFWSYGLEDEDNRRTIDALVRYSHDQGLAARRLSIDELFVPSTLDHFRI
jgi:4,5-dihydroxyphthalate decarboxylase